MRGAVASVGDNGVAHALSLAETARRCRPGAHPECRRPRRQRAQRRRRPATARLADQRRGRRRAEVVALAGHVQRPAGAAVGRAAARRRLVPPAYTATRRRWAQSGFGPVATGLAGVRCRCAGAGRGAGAAAARLRVDRHLRALHRRRLLLGRRPADRRLSQGADAVVHGLLAALRVHVPGQPGRAGRTSDRAGPAGGGDRRLAGDADLDVRPVQDAGSARLSTTTSALLLAEVVALAGLQTAPDMAQSLYWQTGMLTYLLPLVLATLLIGWIRRARRPAAHRPVGAGAVSGWCTFVAGGLSETYLIPQNVALTLALLVVCLLFAPRGHGAAHSGWPTWRPRWRAASWPRGDPGRAVDRVARRRVAGGSVAGLVGGDRHGRLPGRASGALFSAHGPALPGPAGGAGCGPGPRRAAVVPAGQRGRRGDRAVLLLPVVLRPERQSAGALAHRPGRHPDWLPGLRRLYVPGSVAASSRAHAGLPSRLPWRWCRSASPPRACPTRSWPPSTPRRAGTPRTSRSGPVATPARPTSPYRPCRPTSARTSSPPTARTGSTCAWRATTACGRLPRPLRRRLNNRLRRAALAQRAFRGLDDAHHFHAAARAGVRLAAGLNALQEVGALQVQRLGGVQARAEDVARAIGQLELAE